MSQAAADKENKEGKGTWQGLDTDGRGRVKRDGETKPVNQIGEISLPQDSTVFLDSTDSVEFQKATPKTPPNIPTPGATADVNATDVQNRPVVIGETAGQEPLPPYFLFIVVRHINERNCFFNNQTGRTECQWEPPQRENISFRLRSNMIDPELGLGTFTDDITHGAGNIGMDFRHRDVNGNVQPISNPLIWAPFAPHNEPQPDPHVNDLVFYSTRYTQPWIDAGRQDLVDKALRALRHITNTDLAFQVGSEQNDFWYIQNSTFPIEGDFFVPNGGGVINRTGEPSGYALSDVNTPPEWSLNPTGVACPELILDAPPVDLNGCYFWDFPMRLEYSVHALYLEDLSDEDTWHWNFKLNTNRNPYHYIPIAIAGSVCTNALLIRSDDLQEQGVGALFVPGCQMVFNPFTEGFWTVFSFTG